MKNPLRKRLFRELKSEFTKYLVIMVLLIATIGFVSGFLVADGSMLVAYEEGFTKYNVEHGNFRVDKQLNRAQNKAIEEFGVTLFENFYLEELFDNGSTIRMFQIRNQVNLPCLMKGKMPDKAGEIAIDRMYADNNQIAVGDVIRGEKHTFVVTGLIALPDYSCLFQDNNDSMFDAVKFGVALVNSDQFALFPRENLNYSYSWQYSQMPEEEFVEKDLAEDFMEVVNAEAHLQNFVPRYQNNAINFTGEDMGSDKAMMIALLYIVIVILAFVFGITISNTIQQEAAVIGTLRASGYTRMELVRHYMATPIIVTMVGAVAGNILGYTIMKKLCANMYYGSYSLPTYVTIWNAEAFLLTTVIPIFLMALITFVVLFKKMHLTPLQFLRRNLSGNRQKNAIRLPKWIPFYSRFRIRVILQNMSNYLVLFVGILFANLLLLFGMLFPSVLDHYQEIMEENLLCNYQTILQVPYEILDDSHKLQSMYSALQFREDVETENETAEKFSVYSLKTVGGDYKSEPVMCYGIEPDSEYIPLDCSAHRVYISEAYALKFDLGVNDEIIMKEIYEDKYYHFRVSGVYDYIGGIAIFMDQAYLNEVFDLGEDYFCGYFSETPISDIDDKYIGSVIDLDALTRISRQLDVSMGSMMLLVDGFSVLIYVVLIFLLSKLIIEKNGHAISMAKILGYTNPEISGLYIASTSIVVILGILISLPIVNEVMYALFKVIMMDMITGWIPYYLDPVILAKIFLIGVITYSVVAVFEYRKVKNVPMDEALKNVE